MRFVVAAGLLALASAPAYAHDEPAAAPLKDIGDTVMPAPGTYEANGVEVDEKLGARVPLDATFRTLDGRITTLGAAMHANGKQDLPVLLTFNYSNCPMLCSLQLNGLVKALPQLDFRPGAQFQIITIDMEPRETLERAQRMKARYIDQLPADRKDLAAAGWTFLVAAVPGDSTQIERVAEAVGFHYKYLADRAEYAHPAALFALSSVGAMTRYVYGIEFPKEMLSDTIARAGLAEPTSSSGFMNRCYHFDPASKDHSRGGMLAMEIGAAGFLIVFIFGFGFFYLRRVGHHRRGANVL